MTNLTRYDPFTLSRLDPFETLVRDLMPSTYRSMMRTANEPTMPIDVQELEKSFILTVELPGVNKKDIDISITGNQVTINAEAKQEKMPSDAREWCSERWYGSFSRSIQLPQEIEEKDAEASYVDGLLHLTLPKKASGMARKLEVH